MSVARSDDGLCLRQSACSAVRPNQSLSSPAVFVRSVLLSNFQPFSPRVVLCTATFIAKQHCVLSVCSSCLCGSVGLGPWVCGSVGPWVYGSVGLGTWVRGYVGPLVCGSVDLWVRGSGYVGLWVRATAMAPYSCSKQTRTLFTARYELYPAVGCAKAQPVSPLPPAMKAPGSISGKFM